MAAISQVIPNLLGGVSQQPDPLKLPGQVREAENVLLDPTFGCRKRPPTQFVGMISNDVPSGAKWFNIFRDQNERYVVAIYKETDTTRIRVWEADTGIERTVNIDASAGAYLSVDSPLDITELTINDYTLLANSKKVITMDTSVGDDQSAEALVIVNQVAYNTTYTIDFLKDGEQQQQEKVYRANRISISPQSFEENDEGGCVKAGSESFNESSGDKSGLGFTITTQCTPTQVVTEIDGDTYPTQLRNIVNTSTAKEIDPSVDRVNPKIWSTYQHGTADNYAIGSYLYRTVSVNTDAGSMQVRIESRVVKYDDDRNTYEVTNSEIAGYGNGGNVSWNTGIRFVSAETLGSTINVPGIGKIPKGTKVGMAYQVSEVSTGQGSNEYSYKSVYSSRVTLNNGGREWRVGDSVQVTMSGQTYTIRVEEETFGYSYSSEANVSYTTPLDTAAGPLSVGGIVSALVASIDDLGGYTSTPVGNVVHIKRADDRDFNIQVKGGTTNNALLGIKSSVNDISLLPSQCVPGVQLLVRNSVDSDADDYYVKFKPAAGDIPGTGSWEETTKPGIQTDLNPASMPHAMIREADGSFTVRALTLENDDTLYWAPREVGDEESNPAPSFVDSSIRHMFFYNNRLGFLSSDSVVLSQPGDYFNFFIGSAIAVSDADPIDMTASSTKPATLKSALGTSQGLLLFAENSQFILSSADTAFGPATVKMTEISNYSYSSNVRPLETGVSIMFATEADTFSKVYEMAVASVDNRPEVSENSRIVPEYIPPGLTLSTASTNNSIVLFGDGTETLYTFKFHNTNEGRTLAGWSKWIMPADVEMVAFQHDTGYIVLNNDGKHIIAKLEMLDDPRTSPISAFGSKFAPRLDNSLFKSQVTVDSSSVANKNIVRFPDGAYVEGMSPNIILTLDGSSTLYRSPEIQSDETGYFIEVDSYIAEAEFILGLQYDMKIELPSFFVTQDKKADRRNLPMVENVYLDLYYSGRYECTVSRKGYADRTIDLDVTDADIYLANSAAIDEVTTRQIPVYCRGDFVKLTISTPDPLPASITSYRWEGHYNTRGIAAI